MRLNSQQTADQNYQTNPFLRWQCYKYFARQQPVQFQAVEHHFKMQLDRLKQQINDVKNTPFKA